MDHIGIRESELVPLRVAVRWLVAIDKLLTVSALNVSAPARSGVVPSLGVGTDLGARGAFIATH